MTSRKNSPTVGRAGKLPWWFLHIYSLRKCQWSPSSSFVSLPIASLPPWSLGSLRVFCFQGILTGRISSPGWSLFTCFSSFESLLVLLLAVRENVTTTLEVPSGKEAGRGRWGRMWPSCCVVSPESSLSHCSAHSGSCWGTGKEGI